MPLRVTTELLQFLRREGLCEVTGGSEGTLGTSRYALTSKGVERAVEALSLSGYVGPAPVALRDYIDQVDDLLAENQRAWMLIVAGCGDMEPLLDHLAMEWDVELIKKIYPDGELYYVH